MTSTETELKVRRRLRSELGRADCLQTKPPAHLPAADHAQHTRDEQLPKLPLHAILM